MATTISPGFKASGDALDACFNSSLECFDVADVAPRELALPEGKCVSNLAIVNGAETPVYVELGINPKNLKNADAYSGNSGFYLDCNQPLAQEFEADLVESVTITPVAAPVAAGTFADVADFDPAVLEEGCVHCVNVVLSD